jgi:DNA replication protein
MTSFKGFGDGKFSTLAVPAEFLTDLLPSISDATEIKVILCAFQLLPTGENSVKFFFLDDLLQNPDVKKVFSRSSDGSLLSLALENACRDGIFIAGEYEDRKIYFLNTPLSEAANRAMQKGAWSPDEQKNSPIGQSNIFRLYEENIGPLTPILAETLEEVEKEFPADWIEEAVKIAVKKNVRNWNYVEAILRSWKEKGRGEKDQRNGEKNPRRYIEGDLADYIKH